MTQTYASKRKEVSIDLFRPMPTYEFLYQLEGSFEKLLDHEEPVISEGARRAGMKQRSLIDKISYYKDRLYYSVFPLDKYEVRDRPAHLTAQHINSTRKLKYISLGIGLATGAIAYYVTQEAPDSFASYYWGGKSVLGFALAGLFSFINRREHKELSKSLFEQMPNVALQLSSKYPIFHLTGKRIAQFRPRTKGEERKLSMQKYLGFNFGRRRVDLRDAMTGWEAVEKDRRNSDYQEDIGDEDNESDDEDDGESWKR